MKRCPQCNSLYEDSVQFCLNDGNPLTDESFSLPSDEEETIIRHDPITINIPAPNEQGGTNYYNPPVENVVVVPADSVSANRNYALFLIVGLLIGGGLVLGTLLLARNYFQSAKTNSINVTANSNRITATENPKSTPDAVNTNIAAVENPSGKHDEPNPDVNDGLFNGRVIASNARIRNEPSSNASVVDVLPFGDRLDIIDRAGSNSPWYQVECEHGTTGWMHGDTIEFTKGNF